MPGLSMPAMHGKMSLRASLTVEIVMQDVEVSEAQMLPDADRSVGPLGVLIVLAMGLRGCAGCAEFCWHAGPSHIP